MPILATFLGAIATRFLGFFVTMFGTVWGIRLAAATALATGYAACVVYYSSMIGPWLGTIFSTAYGALLGLLFPPVAGSVLAGLVAFWTCVAVQQYSKTLWKLAAG